MAGAIIRIDQIRPGPSTSAGVAGVSRDDLWVGSVIQGVSTTTNGTYLWTLLDKPAGSTAVLVGDATATCSFTPDLPGTYRLQLSTVDGATTAVQTRLCAVRFDVAGVLIGRGWRVPAFRETADEANFVGNTRGWAASVGEALASLNEGVESVAEDIARNGGGDIALVQGLKGVPLVPTDVLGDGETWIKTRGANTLRRGKPLPEGWLDPRDFGCKWDGVSDDLPGMLALLANIPTNTAANKRAIVKLPEGVGYFSGRLPIDRCVDIVGQGREYPNGTAIDSGMKFAPGCGIDFHGYYTSPSYPNGNADNSRIINTTVCSTQMIVTDAGGNIGRGSFFLDTSLDIWSALPATVQLGSVVFAKTATVGSIADYYNDGATRDTTHLVMLRCTTAGTKGTEVPANFAALGLADIGETIPATGGTAVWTVESIPKDYQTQTAYVVGQRVFVPGDPDHAFECEVAGTSFGWSTTITAASDAVSLPQATINVADTSTFPDAGTARVFTASGFQVVTYTSKTATTLDGCTGGVGAMSTGGAVTAPLNFAAWGIGTRVPNSFVAPAYRTVFYDRATAITAASDGLVLPQATINVTDTTEFAAAGTIQVWTGTAYEAVTYTGKTATTFTGCTGGTGTINTDDPVGQGIRWRHIPTALVNVLATWVDVEGCALFGATGPAVWVQANTQPDTANGSYSAGGSNFWSVRECLIGMCASGIVTNSNNTNGGESANIHDIFMGGGRTFVDGPNYLNMGGDFWGNGSAGLKDRTQGNSNHRNHYLQFGTGMAFRNDLFAAGTPTGNSSVFLYMSAETDFPPRFHSPAIVIGAPHGVAKGNTAAFFDGTESQNLRTSAPLVSDATKRLRTVFGPQNAGVANVLTFGHSDDSNDIAIGITDDMTYYPAKWFAFGKANNAGAFTEQAFLFPRPYPAGATWPSGEAVPAELPMWINNSRVWIGDAPNADPASIGFGTAVPTVGYYVRGSVIWNKNATAGAPLGWRCTTTGSPGTWEAMSTSSQELTTTNGAAPFEFFEYEALTTGVEQAGPTVTIPADTVATFNVEATFIAPGAEASKAFSTRRYLHNKAGVVTATTQVDLLGPDQIVGTSPATLNTANTGNAVRLDVSGAVGRWIISRQVTSITAAAPAPDLVSISPTSGTESTATPITLTGTSFVSGAVVAFISGGVPIAATNVVFGSATSITCDAPVTLGAGTYDMRITNPDGQSDTLVGAYTATAAGAALDPTTRTLTSYHRGSYVNPGPWNGTASAGTSGTLAISEATNPPATGAALDTFTPADFDGVNDLLLTGAAPSSLISSATGFIMGMFYARTLVADTTPAAYYGAPAIFTDGDGYCALAPTSAGVRFGTYDANVGAFGSVLFPGAFAAGWHAVFARWSTVDSGGGVMVTTQELRVDNGAWVSYQKAIDMGPTALVIMGNNYAAAAPFDGLVQERATAQYRPDDAEINDWYAYLKARYPSAGLP